MAGRPAGKSAECAVRGSSAVVTGLCERRACVDALVLTWGRWHGRRRPSSAAAVASLGAGRGHGPWLTAVDGRPRPRCARGFRSRTSSLHQVPLGLCEGELGTWGDPRVNGGGACASPTSKPLSGNPRARSGRSRCRRGVFVPAPSESGVRGQEFPPDVAGTSSGGLTVPPSPAGFGVGAGPEGRETRKNTEQPLTEPMESENLPNTEHPSEQTRSLRR